MLQRYAFPMSYSKKELKICVFLGFIANFASLTQTICEYGRSNGGCPAGRCQD